jgi:hypothetical protein
VRARDAGKSLQVEPPDASEQGIDCSVDARDEEARDGRDLVDRLSMSQPGLEAGQIRLDERGVRLERKEQRRVDVDSVGDDARDCIDAGRGRRDLDHRVRPVEPRPKVARRRDCRIGVVSQIRWHLETDVTVEPVRAPVDRREHVGERLHVGDNERVEEAARGHHVREESGPGRVVRAASHRAVEDRWVRREAGNRVAFHQAGQFHRLDEGVDPDAGAERSQPIERVHLAKLLPAEP